MSINFGTVRTTPHGEKVSVVSAAAQQVELAFLQKDFAENLGSYGYDVPDEFEEVATIEGEHRRWFVYTTVVIRNKHSGNLYGYTYDQGLTENQENEYYGSKIFPMEAVEVTTTTYKQVKP